MAQKSTSTSRKRSGNRRGNRGHGGGPSGKGRNDGGGTSREAGGAKPKPGLLRKVLDFLGFVPEEEEGRSAPRQQRKPRQQQSQPVDSERLFVGNLDYAVKDSDLRELFGKAGTVESAEVVVHGRSERSKGFGFVTMASVDEARAAAAELDGQQLKGRSISVTGAKSSGKKGGEEKRPSKSRKPERPKSERPKPDAEEKRERRSESSSAGESSRRSSRKRGGRKAKGRDSERGSSSGAVTPMAVPEVSSPDIVLSNLDAGFVEADLEFLFEGIGSAAEVEFADGTARVRMESVEDAQRAVRFLDGKDFMEKTLSVKPAAPLAEEGEKEGEKEESEKALSE